jgi:peptidoglycan hydrolase CwlO-like protein
MRYFPDTLKKGSIMVASVLFMSLLFFHITPIVSTVFSESVDDLEGELEQTQEELENKSQTLQEVEDQIAAITSSTYSLNQKITELEKLITDLKKDINSTEERIETLDTQITNKEKELTKKKEQSQKVAEALYKSSRQGYIEVMLAQRDTESLRRASTYKEYIFSKQAEAMSDLNEEIAQLNADHKELETKKSELDDQKSALAKTQKTLKTEKQKLQSQLYAQSSYSSQLQGEISLLNNKITKLQEQILIAKSGAYIPPADSLPTAADYNATAAGFRENAPSGNFAVFSFGAYTHRKGMSQYGALARANNGQGYKKILKDYYGKSPVSKKTSGKIKVSGHGNLEFDGYYLYGIAEMPSSWPLEALKAQAVAARTYAYRYYVQDKQICTTQACQVFLKSKADNPPAKWKQAVDETQGMVLTDVVTYYSATSGGYLTTSGWDTKSGSYNSNWTSEAWESIAGSPWFYKAWYRASYSDSSSSCGRYPWLSEEEMADIINTWLVLEGSGLKTGVDESRILPVTVNDCPFGSITGNPYSMSEMRNLLNNPVTSISGMPGINFNTSAGLTDNIVFQTNRGTVVVPGSDFKTVFNTRAPGYLSVPQNGFWFINVERKL